MNTPHVVFVDSTLAGLLALRTAREMGCRVSFIEPADSSFLAISTSDASRVLPHLAHAHEHHRIPSLQGDALDEALRDMARRHGPVSALITTSEAAILPVARAAEALGVPGPGLAALERAVFKDRCRAAVRAAGLRSPDFEVVSEDRLIAGHARRIPVPLVVKPTRGFGKQFSAVCHSDAAFDHFVATLKAAREQGDPMIDHIVSRDYIIETYITGSLHSCEVVVVDGELHFYAGTTRYRAAHNELLEMGYAMPSGLAPAEQAALEEHVRAVFGAIGLRFGLYHVELILAEDGPCLVEINGRMMGGVGPQAYTTVSGLDAFEWLLRLHLGEKIAPDAACIQRAATVVLIGARAPGTVSATFTQGRLDALLQAHGIDFCTLKLTAGMPLRRFEGNVSVLGHVIVPGPDPEACKARGHQFLQELDALLGVETAKYLDADTDARAAASA
jgi:biotin carboxylase